MLSEKFLLRLVYVLAGLAGGLAGAITLSIVVFVFFLGEEPEAALTSLLGTGLSVLGSGLIALVGALAVFLGLEWIAKRGGGGSDSAEAEKDDSSG